MAGWYAWPRRDSYSPFASQAEGIPYVTEDDFSYITSQDIESENLHAPRGSAQALDDEEDDVLNIKHKGRTYPIQFPAYSIGDGKLWVRDVHKRVGLVMGLNRRQSEHLKMLYKGRQLKEFDVPIRTYNVKNNSELMVVVPEEASDSSSEDIVVTEASGTGKGKKKKNNKKKKKTQNDGPRDSGANLDIPNGDHARPSSADSSRHPSRIPSPNVPAGPSEKLDSIRAHFDTELLPLCNEFMASPPTEAKKLEDEHRKLSETTMQHVLLKLDEVDTGGDPDIRAKRKALVNYVQDILKKLDDCMPEGFEANR